MAKSIVFCILFAVVYLCSSLPLDPEIVEHRVKRGSNGITDIKSLWPNKTVPYRINETGYSDEQILLIKNAIAEIETKTCVKFVEYTNQKNFVTFTSTGTECLASVGQDSSENDIQLNTKLCMTNKMALHEIMHKLGFEHIHNSPDRDKYIKININNIPEEQRKSYEKIKPEANLTDFGFGYDFDSVMHYRSRNTKKDPFFMEALTGQADTDKMGQLKHLSDGDVARIRAMYNCDGDRPEQDNLGLEDNKEAVVETLGSAQKKEEDGEYHPEEEEEVTEE